MAFDLDGLAVLAAMAAKPDVFAGIEAEAAKAAHALLGKLLKDKATALPAARAMAAALPKDALAHVVEGMKDSEVAALVTRLDRHNLNLATADRPAKAALLGRLIAGAAEPTEPAARSRKAVAPRAAAARKPAPSGVEAAKKVIQSKAMGARKAAKPAAAKA